MKFLKHIRLLVFILLPVSKTKMVKLRNLFYIRMVTILSLRKFKRSMRAIWYLWAKGYTTCYL